MGPRFWGPAALFALCLSSVAGAHDHGAASASDGLVVMPSAHSVDTTLDRLTSALEDKGLTVFTRIDHAAGAARAGLEMRPTQVLLFGNPAIGTPIMQCAPAAAVDFPQKALVWEDAEGRVFLAYNDPQYLAARHQIEGCDAELQKMSDALDNFTRAATDGGD
ncbi:DUF302 domain-containing protein [Ectothiorhodospiraceae bacterium 2226]|nr:DUF302 domain-containing protein [Ectothiorhodospiraceae bacterium 2226]